MFNRNKDEVFCRYITMDVTTLQNPIDSQPSGLNAKNRIERFERSNGQLTSVLRDARGIIFIDYLEKGQTINSEYKIAFLERLNDEIKKKVLFHQNNAPVHINSNQSKQRQNCMNEATSCFPIYRILQIWPSVTLSVCRPQKYACWKEN
jgi:hypothetical protein